MVPLCYIVNISITTEILPITENPWAPDSWVTLIRWGVVREQDLGDSFRKCKLPDGWKKIPTEPSWSRLVDSRGLIRAKIYCDDNLKASISVVKRFIVQEVRKKDQYYISEQYQVFDQGLNRPIFFGCEVKCIIANQCIGAIQGKDFYLLNEGKLEKSESQKNWAYLSIDEFSANWCNKAEISKFVQLVREMASVSCESQVKSLPNDDSAWRETFDFPESQASE